MHPRPLTVTILLSLAVAGCDRPALLGDPVESWVGPSRPALNVTLVDQDGQPLEGAWAVLTPTGRDKLTDATGLASFHALDPGVYTVEGAAYGFDLGDEELTLGEVDADLTLALEPRGDRGGADGATP